MKPAGIADTLPSAFPEMLYIGRLQDSLDLLLSHYHGYRGVPGWISTDSGYQAPDGYQGLVLDIAGRAGVVLVPQGKADSVTHVVGADVKTIYQIKEADKGILLFPLLTGSWSIRTRKGVRTYRMYQY